jgi:hypothetical protein
LDSQCPTPSGKIVGVIIEKSAAPPQTVPPFARLPLSFRSAQRDGILSGYFAIGRFLTIGSRVAEGYHAFQPSKATLGNPSARFERQNSRPAAPASLLTVKTFASDAQPNFRPSKSPICAASRSFDRQFARKNPLNRFYFKDLADLTVGTARCAVRSAERSVRRCFPRTFTRVNSGDGVLPPFPGGDAAAQRPYQPSYWSKIISQISSAAEAVRGFAT